MAAPNSLNQTIYVTPQKNRDIDCFVCFSANVTFFKLCGTKLMDENFNDTLISLLDHSVTYEQLTEKDAAPIQRSSRKQLKLFKETLDLETYSPALIPVTEIPEETVTLVSVCPTASVPDHGYSKQISTIKPKFNHDILETIKKSVTSLGHETACILTDIKSQAAILTSRTTMLASVLYKYRDISNLADNAENLLADIVKEMQESINIQVYYKLLLNRFFQLRTRRNHLGLVLSPERRQRLQDSAQEKTLKLVTETLKSQPLVKITGDNLGIYVKTSNLGINRRNKDHHLFTSYVLFSRVATIDMNNDSPKTDLCKISSEQMLLNNNYLQRQKLIHAYSVLLGRILCKLPAFHTFKKAIPEHIPQMSEKSIVLPLPIQFKNEAKYGDCLSIMDCYEDQLTKIYIAAFGNIDLLRKYKVPLGGDQLTRVRLQEARNLRTLSVTPEKRFDDLNPIVCEMWHCKQDFLEKCSKTLYKADNAPGTLNFFKTILHRTNVNGQVKGHFQSHYDLLMAVGEDLVKEQFLEFFNMENETSKPTHPLLTEVEGDNLSEEEKKDIIYNIIADFVRKYGYGMVDTPDGFSIVKPQYSQQSQPVILDGKLTMETYMEPIMSEPDELYNYSLQLCH
ncbi:hypothetical protein ScPMuIL_007061 [Solemya velum]